MNRMIKQVALALSLIGLWACQEKETFVHVGPNWQALSEFKAKQDDFSFNVSLKKAYKLGEKMNLSITSPKEGKLWVLYVDPDDRINLMYPNEMASENVLVANKTLLLPDDSWEIQATEPLGHSLIAFIVTTGDADLQEVLKQSSKQGVAKALRLVEQTPEWAIQKHVVEVTK